MDLKIFKPLSATAELLDLPVVYVAIGNPEGDASLVAQPWFTLHPFIGFKDLVNGQAPDEAPRIVIVPDYDKHLKQVQLVCNNASTVECSLVWVKGLGTYSPSAQAEASFWNVQFVNFDDWRLEAEEALRASTLAARAALGPDELARVDATRSSGKIKAFAHNEKVIVSKGEPPHEVSPDDAVDSMGVESLSF